MQESRHTAGEYSDNAGQRITVFALLASILLHLLSIYYVKIFVAPSAVYKWPVSNVSFLGGILEEEPAIASKINGGINRAQAGDLGLSRMQSLVMSEILAARSEKVYGQKPAFAPDFDILKEIELKAEDPSVLTGAKQVPQKPFDKVMVSYKAYPLEVKGPARFREIIYKPDLPTYLRWDEELGVDLDRIGNSFQIELKFWVSPEGKVDLVERVSSSGHPTVDLVAIRYLKGWQFAPLASASSGGQNLKQWGTVKLNLNLNRAGEK